MRLVASEGVADSDLLTLERPESRRSKKGRILTRSVKPMPPPSGVVWDFQRLDAAKRHLAEKNSRSPPFPWVLEMLYYVCVEEQRLKPLQLPSRFFLSGRFLATRRGRLFERG